jgi:hypothetical protein
MKTTPLREGGVHPICSLTFMCGSSTNSIDSLYISLPGDLGRSLSMRRLPDVYTRADRIFSTVSFVANWFPKHP